MSIEEYAKQMYLGYKIKLGNNSSSVSLIDFNIDESNFHKSVKAFSEELKKLAQQDKVKVTIYLHRDLSPRDQEIMIEAIHKSGYKKSSKKYGYMGKTSVRLLLGYWLWLQMLRLV